MSTKSVIHKSYVGPRALFDPFYVPSELIGLNKEQNSMQSILKDAIQDRYPIILSLYGLKGIGKTTLTRKTIAGLESSKSVNLDMHYVNCEEKDANQIVFSLINGISQSLNYDLSAESILHSTPSNQINLLTHLITKTIKSDELILFFLDSVEYTQPRLINKLMDVCTSQSCILVTSFNILKSSPCLLEFKKPDLQIQLNTYTPTTLEKISINRCNAAFKYPVERMMIRYLSDLVSEFDYCVPESCLRVLRELYPLIERNAYVDPEQIQDACRYQFKNYSIDEISIAEFISETDLVDRLALDEISSFFQSQTRYYIKYSELANMYKVACESLECQYILNSFNKFTRKLQRVGLLQPSTFINEMVDKKVKITNPFYFLTISPQMLNEILDFAFGFISFE